MRLPRRALLGAALALAAALPARAQESSATGFVQAFGSRVVQILNQGGSVAQKQAAIRPLIDQAVDVQGIATFCLGIAARTATPAQRQQYDELFHRVLVNNVLAKVGQYQGVTFRVTGSAARADGTVVSTVVTPPNNAPVNAQWVVSTSSGSPKIVDLIVEGTSLRLTQRADYNSFLSQHGNNVDALIGAIRRQVGG